MANTAMKITCLALIVLMVLATKIFYGATPRDTVGDRNQLVHEETTLVYFELRAADAESAVVMVPSLGRSASDFNELALDMQQAGYDVLLVEPRGMRARGGLDNPNITLFDLADDVAAIVDDAGIDRHVIIGHAFGNRVSRAYATKYPQAVNGTVLVAAGGKVEIAPAIRDALIRTFWTWMPDGWRAPKVRLAFFAGDNEMPDYWMRGWNIPTSQMQIRSTMNTASADWWGGGRAPLLVVQGMQDTIAPPEHTADLLEQEFGTRVRVARIENAGHAILPEHPEAVFAAVKDFVETVQ